MTVVFKRKRRYNLLRLSTADTSEEWSTIGYRVNDRTWKRVVRGGKGGLYEWLGETSAGENET